MEGANLIRQANKRLQLLTFKIGFEEFGIEIIEVLEILRIMGISKIPSSLPLIDGVINYRGKTIPVVDFRNRLSMESPTYDFNSRIVVIDMHGITVGFVVDEVAEVLQ